MSILTLFKSRASTMGYAFKSGKTVHFMGGQYATSSEVEIKELTEECNNGHPVFYIDQDQKTIDSEALDPMSALIAKIRAEERAKILAATDINRDMGTTDQNTKLLGISNSQSVAGLIAESESQAMAANPQLALTQNGQQAALPAGIGKINIAPSARSLKQ